MAVNKVEYCGEVLIDLSADTLVSASQIKSGVTGHLADGTVVTGTMEADGEATPVEVYEDAEGNIVVSGSVGVISVTDQETGEAETASYELTDLVGIDSQNGLKENITQSNQALEALIEYSNGVTKAEDENIGDAIKTLSDGFGGSSGGSEWELVTKDTLVYKMSDFITEEPTSVNTTIPAMVSNVVLPVSDEIPTDTHDALLMQTGYLDIKYFDGAPNQKTRGHQFYAIQVNCNIGGRDATSERGSEGWLVNNVLNFLYDNSAGVLNARSTMTGFQMTAPSQMYQDGTRKIIRINNVGRPQVIYRNVTGYLDSEIWSYIDKESSTLTFRYWLYKIPKDNHTPNPMAIMLRTFNVARDIDVEALMAGR